MKKLSLLMSVILLSITVRAQDLSMIQSIDDLYDYASRQINTVSASFTSTIYLGDRSYARQDVIQPLTTQDADQILASLPLSISSVSPADTIEMSAEYVNVAKWPMFMGKKEFRLVNTKGGYEMPQDYANITLPLAVKVPISVPGARVASLHITGFDGQTIAQFPIDVDYYSGYIFFPKIYAHANARLGIYISEKDPEFGAVGEWRYWDVRTGERVQPENFSVNMNPTIPKFLTFRNDSEITVRVPNTMGRGMNKIIQYTTDQVRVVQINVYTSDEEEENRSTFENHVLRFHKFWKGARITDGETEVVIDAQNNLPGLFTVTFRAQPGFVYNITPLWEEGDFIEIEDLGGYIFYPVDGGKG